MVVPFPAWGDPPHCFPRGLHFAPAARGSPLAHILPSTGCLVSLAAVLSGARSYLTVTLLWSLMVSDVAHLFTCLLAICVFSERHPLESSARFKIRFLGVFLPSWNLF